MIREMGYYLVKLKHWDKPQRLYFTGYAFQMPSHHIEYSEQDLSGSNLEYISKKLAK